MNDHYYSQFTSKCNHLQQLDNLLAGYTIQTASWLIKEENTRFSNQLHSDVDTFALPAGNLLRSELRADNGVPNLVQTKEVFNVPYYSLAVLMSSLSSPIGPSGPLASISS
eukprot:scpid104780/ scgid2704/ 